MNMRWLRLTIPAAALAAWLAVSFGQQPAPPPPANEQTEEPEAPPAPEPADDEDSDDVEVPTVLEPDAAVTFPVDI